MLDSAHAIRLPTFNTFWKQPFTLSHASMPIRVVLADPFALVCEAVRMLIEKDPGIDVVGTASQGKETLRLTEKLAPAILLLEPLICNPAGPDLVRQLQASDVTVPVLVLSRCRQIWMMDPLMEEGAYGYLLKEESPTMLFEALYGVACGEGGWMRREIASKLYSRNPLGLIEAHAG